MLSSLEGAPGILMPPCCTTCTGGLSGEIISTPLVAPCSLSPGPARCPPELLCHHSTSEPEPWSGSTEPQLLWDDAQGSSRAISREKELLCCTVPCPAPVSHTGLREAGMSLLRCWDGSLGLRTSLPNRFRAHFLYLLSYDCKL